MSAAQKTPWWGELYDDWLADVLLERENDGEVERTLAFLQGALEIAPRMRVFDQCCGIGSLSVPLVLRGCELVGCDLMPNYIARAEAFARDSGVNASFVVADAFEYVTDGPCDAAFNWWTSFGYARSDTENLRMLKRAFDSLKPGGGFALDFMNVPGVLRHFQPQVITRRDTRRGRVTLVRDTQLDLRAMAMLKRWTYTLPDGDRAQRDTWVRMYTPYELLTLLAQAGYVDIVLYGDVDGSALALDSPRCIAVGRRPR